MWMVMRRPPISTFARPIVLPPLSYTPTVESALMVVRLSPASTPIPVFPPSLRSDGAELARRHLLIEIELDEPDECVGITGGRYRDVVREIQAHGDPVRLVREGERADVPLRRAGDPEGITHRIDHGHARGIP